MMMSEETYLEILKDAGPMSAEDRTEIAHRWFATYSDEFFTVDSDTQRCIARLYTLIRDTQVEASEEAVPIFTLYSRYQNNIDAKRLCDAINAVMRTYNGTEEHFGFVWRSAALPCTVDDVYAKIPASSRTFDKYRDVYNVIANL